MSRPLFLSVICIITFVFSSLGLLGSIWGCAPSTIESGLVAMLEMQAKELDFVVFNESEYLKWTFYSNVAGIVGGILCVIGALAMWVAAGTLGLWLAWVLTFGLWLAMWVAAGI